MRIVITSPWKSANTRIPNRPITRPYRPGRYCPLRKQAGRADTTHFQGECSFLPDQDRKYIAKARQIVDIIDNPMEPEATSSVDEPYSDSDDNTPVLSP